jgi:hypothetical protein
MHLLASELPEHSVVSAMEGGGGQLSILLIAEIGDACRFRSGSALLPAFWYIPASVLQ